MDQLTRDGLEAHVVAFATSLGRATSLDETRRIFATYPLNAAPTPGIVLKYIESPVGIWIGSEEHSAHHRGLYLHGGGYIAGSPAMYVGLVSRIAEATRSWIFVPKIPLAPENLYPKAHEAAFAAARYVQYVGPSGAGPKVKIFLAGDSCGAALAFATAIRLREEEGVGSLSALIGLSPLLDMSADADSYDRCAADDKMISRDVTRQCARLYAPGMDLADHRISPIRGRLDKLPPMLLQVSENEVAVDDSTRASLIARQDGGHLEVQTWKGMPHVWHLLAPCVREGSEAIARIGQFITATQS